MTVQTEPFILYVLNLILKDGPKEVVELKRGSFRPYRELCGWYVQKVIRVYSRFRKQNQDYLFDFKSV